MRKRIYEIIEVDETGDLISKCYDILMMSTIVISLLPLMFKTDVWAFQIIDKVCVVIFIIDYLLRLITADYNFEDKKYAFIRYPFSTMAIIDLLSILPSLTHVNQALKALRLMRLIRLLRLFRVFRVFRSLRYSKSIVLIARVIRNAKPSLMAIGTFALAYIYISALIIFNVEPDTFDNFFEALYWATVSLTTVGYGDIYPVTSVGRILSMLSSLFGIAVVALPASVITAGYLKEVESKNDDEDTVDE